MVDVAMKHMALNFAKLDKFEGVDFRRWQKKMHFLLSSMSVVFMLTTPIPEDGGDDATVEQLKKRAKWMDDDVAWWVNSGARVHVCIQPHSIVLNWLNIANDNIGSGFMSTSELNDSILWHARLCHVHFKMMQDMSKDGLIPAFDMDTEKCKTCMLNKITKKTFQDVKREIEVLELIHKNVICMLQQNKYANQCKVFSTWMAFGGNTRDLGSFGEETDKITDLHQFHEEVLFTEGGDGVKGVK
ncbi:zinc finger, CCHC-type containing protein [Tanacetum coccineum]